MTGTPDEGMLFLAGAGLILLAFLLPNLWQLLVTVRARPILPRRTGFVAVVASLSYGFVLLFIVLVSVLEQAGGPYGSWLVGAARVLISYGIFLVPVTLAVVAVLVSRQLARKWPRIVAALSGQSPARSDGA